MSASIGDKARHLLSILRLLSGWILFSTECCSASVAGSCEQQLFLQIPSKKMSAIARLKRLEIESANE